MKKEIKDIIVTIIFLILIIGGCVLNILVSDKTISISERRKLKQFPEITLNKILKNNFLNELESYTADQFVGRDFYRNIKAIVNLKVLRKKDNNNYFMKDGIIYKQPGKVKENEIEKATRKFNKIKEKYLKDNKIYFSIIPDKTYFVKDNELRMDYKKIEEIMKRNLSNMKYINIFDILKQNDYYKTDTHWKQENLLKVAEKLSREMTGQYILENIEVKTKGDFKGVYAGQIGLKTDNTDKLNYITNQTIENSTTFNIETNKTGQIYDEEKWNKSFDKYDYFLSGATPIIEIVKNEKENKNNKELIIFRDSFGSSIAPLLIENYDKITLIDIRYIASKYLDKYIEFNNQDVLFLYSTSVLNEASILK